MEFPLDELIEIFSSELHPNNDLRTVKNLIFTHPLMKNEYKSMSLEQLALLIYSVYFISNGRKVETLNRLRENIVFYIVCDFDYGSSKTVICDTCDGDGDTNCGECNGSGEVSCNECDGEGRIEVEDNEWEDCEVCNGNGEVSCRELTIILDRDSYSHTIDDDSYYWRDVEENSEMFYEVVDRELRLTEINWPTFD